MYSAYNITHTHVLNSTLNKTLRPEIQNETFKLHWEFQYKFLTENVKIRNACYNLLKLHMLCLVIYHYIYIYIYLRVSWNFPVLFNKHKDNVIQRISTIFIHCTSLILVVFLSIL